MPNNTISDEYLVELASRIKPIIYDAGVYYEIEVPSDLRKTSFLWAAKKIRVVENPKFLQTIPSHHTYGHPSLFKPSIAEVMEDLVLQEMTDINYFEVKNPQIAGNYHVAECNLFL